MDDRPTLLTLVAAFGLGPARYQVLAAPPGAPPSAGYGSEVATLVLNRSITVPDGQIYQIRRRGRFFSTDRELLSGDGVGQQPPLALSLSERTGLLRWRNVVVVCAAPQRRYLLRRRKWYGSPANCDLVPLAPDGALTEGAVLLRAEILGGWRRRLQGLLSASPTELSLPVAIFVLNMLADLDRRAAAAASAGAAGV